MIVHSNYCSLVKLDFLEIQKEYILSSVSLIEGE